MELIGLLWFMGFIHPGGWPDPLRGGGGPSTSPELGLTGMNCNMKMEKQISCQKPANTITDLEHFFSSNSDLPPPPPAAPWLVRTGLQHLKETDGSVHHCTPDYCFWL